MTKLKDQDFPTKLSDTINLEDKLGVHISLAYAMITRAFQEQFEHLKLTPKQNMVLFLIDAHPGISQTNLCDTLSTDRATIMAIINRLESRNLCERKASVLDRRRLALYLTKAGEDLLVEAKLALQENNEWLKSHYSEDELTTLISLLSRLPYSR